MSEPIHMISLGGGRQSSRIALGAARGEIAPMPVAAIFADTQAEPASVYKWLDWLEKQLPFPVHRVTQGSLSEDALTMRKRKDGNGQWSPSGVPHFSINPDGSFGQGNRQCTSDFKLAPLMREQRRILKERGAKQAVCWIGISLDEAYRMKPSRVKYVTHRWPLIEMRETAADCLKWFVDRGLPKPPRSACVFCPYHSDKEWRRLRDEEPEEFAKAVQFERDYTEIKAQQKPVSGAIPFLHAKRIPLDQVDFSTEEERGQLNMFNNECEGMCGV